MGEVDPFAAHDRTTVLVLDDLHEIAEARITDGLEFFLDHLPTGQDTRTGPATVATAYERGILPG